MRIHARSSTFALGVMLEKPATKKVRKKKRHINIGFISMKNKQV
jgi:hypothetical protein